ncbi:MAG: metallophosphoesterase [Candidatus Sericytochromatia bacterium]
MLINNETTSLEGINSKKKLIDTCFFSTSQKGHSLQIKSLCLSPDSRFLVTASLDKTIKIWNLKTKEVEKTLVGHLYPLVSLSISPDGKFIASLSDDNIIKVWNSKNGSLVYTSKVYWGTLESVCLGPEGKHLIIISNDNTIRVLNITSDKIVKTLKDFDDLVSCLAFNPDGKSFAAGSESGEIKIWSIRGNKDNKILENHRYSIKCMVYSNDGKQLLCNDESGTVRVWEINSEKVHQEFIGGWGNIVSFNILGNGRYTIAGTNDRNIKVWNFPSNSQPISLQANWGRFSSVCVNSNNYLATGSVDGTTKIYDIDNDKILHTYRAHNKAIKSIVFNSNNKIIASSSEDYTIKIWDIKSAKNIFTLTGHTSIVHASIFSPDSQYLYSASNDGFIKAWSLVSGGLIYTIKDNWDNFLSLSISPNGDFLVSGSEDRTIKIWNAKSGEFLDVYYGHKGDITCVCFTPDGKYLISGSTDKTIKIWSIDKSKLIQTFEGHLGEINSLCVSPDNSYLASGSSDNTLILWDLKSRNRLTSYIFKSSVVSVSFSSNYIAACDLTGEIRLFSTKKLSEILPSEVYERYLNAKVILVGDTGVGKTGLGIRLAEKKWEITDSTHGMNLWTMAVGQENLSERVKKEIILWDFAGQEDYLLIHQLFLDNTHLALLLYDPGIQDTFKRVEFWLKCLKKQIGPSLLKILVGARCDTSTPKASQDWISTFLKKEGIAKHISTSAKMGLGINDLIDEIEKGVIWDDIPITSSPKIFNLIKEKVYEIRDQNKVLLPYEEFIKAIFSIKEIPQNDILTIDTVISSLEGMGLIMKIAPTTNAQYILLRPDILNQYASAILRQVARSEDGIGMISDREIIEARFDLSGINRLESCEEQIVLESTIELFISKDLCFRRYGNLVFPSKMRSDPPSEKRETISEFLYDFKGSLDNIYAYLAVELSYTGIFKLQNLWKDRAEFISSKKELCGISLILKQEGVGRLDVYFSTNISPQTRILFSQFVKKVLEKEGLDLEETLTTRCPCGYIIDEKVVSYRKQKELESVTCSSCDRIISLNRSMNDLYNQEISKSMNRMQKNIKEGRAKALSEVKTSISVHLDVRNSLENQTQRNTLKIAHISDIHFKKDSVYKNIYQPFSKDLRNLGVQRLDALIVSGDITDRSEEDEYKIAAEFFQVLMDDFGLNSDRLVLVPGNHDLNWNIALQECYKSVLKGTVNIQEYKSGEIHQEVMTCYIRQNEKYPKRFQNFSDYLYKPIFGVNYPNKHEDQVEWTQIDSKVGFLSLNSSHEIDCFFTKRSGINTSALTNGLSKIPSLSKDFLKISVFHHPLRGEEAMSSDFMERLAGEGFKVCMHGHIHKVQDDLFKWDYYNQIQVIGAGTFGSKSRSQSTPFQYNYIEIDTEDKTIRVNTRKKNSEEGAWEADARWHDRILDPKPFYEIKY